MKKILITLFILLISNSCFALQIPKDFDLEAFLNKPYYGKSFEQAMSKQKPFLLIMGNTKYAHTMVRFIPVGEMVDKEFGHDFNFCIINTKMPENNELVEYFQPPNPKLPALYIVDTKQSKYVYIDKKYYTKRGIRKVLKKYLASELF